MASPLRRTACQAQQRLSQKTLLAYLTPESKQAEFFNSMSLNDWAIISFDPSKRQACVMIYKPSGNTVINVSIQSVSSSSGEF